MRLSHWTALAPICPRCKSVAGELHPLLIADVFSRDEVIQQGIIHCPSVACQQEYPIIDGAPILVPNVKEYIAAYASQINLRGDLHDHLQTLVSDCLGSDDAHNLSRFYLASYGFDGYRDLFEEHPQPPEPSLVSLYRACNELMPKRSGTVLDLGCATGRTSMELAQTPADLVLGVDINFSFVQFAQRLLRDGVGETPARQVGMVHHTRRFDVTMANLEKVDYWVCDAQNLPFRDGIAQTVLALNLLDSVHSPLQLLMEVGRILAASGQAAYATPFDWSVSVTPVENWLGGHSQRGGLNGDPVSVLKSLFPLTCDGGQLHWGRERDDLLWQSTRGARSTTEYREFAFSLSKVGSG
jgi:SAM-dependent methyltransferase/uncharacterized protein YbaR (Trm112 family)